MSEQIYDLYKPKTMKKYVDVDKKWKKDNSMTLKYLPNAYHLTDIKQLSDHDNLIKIIEKMKLLHNVKLKKTEYVDYNTIFGNILRDIRDYDMAKKIKNIDPDFSLLNWNWKLIHGDLWLNNIVVSDWDLYFVDGNIFNLKTQSSLWNPYIDVAHFIAVWLFRKAYYYKITEHKYMLWKQIEWFINTILKQYFDNELFDEYKFRLALALSFLSKVANYENIFHWEKYEEEWKKLKVLCEKMTIISLEAKSIHEIFDIFLKKICVSENEKKINLTWWTVNDVKLNVDHWYVEKDYKSERSNFIRDLYYHLYSPLAPKIKDIGKSLFYQEFLDDYKIIGHKEYINNYDLLDLLASKLNKLHQKTNITKLVNDFKNKNLIKKYSLKELNKKDPYVYSYKYSFKSIMKRANNKILSMIFQKIDFDILSKQENYRVIHGDVWTWNILINKIWKLYLIDGEAFQVKNYFSVWHPYADITLFVILTFIIMPIQTGIVEWEKIPVNKILNATKYFLDSYSKKINRKEFEIAFILNMINKLSDITYLVRKKKLTEDQFFYYQILIKNIDSLENDGFLKYIKNTLNCCNKLIR